MTDKNNGNNITKLSICIHIFLIMVAAAAIAIADHFGWLTEILNKRKEICLFMAGAGMTMIGFIMALRAIVMTLNGRVFFERYKNKGGFDCFSTLCYWVILGFLSLVVFSLLGLGFELFFKISLVIFSLGLMEIVLLSYITKNLTINSQELDNRNPCEQLDIMQRKVDLIEHHLSEISKSTKI